MIVVSQLDTAVRFGIPCRLGIANRAASSLSKLQTRIVQAEPLHFLVEGRTIDIQCVSC